MWFGLIPGPFRVARAIDRTYSRNRRRTYSHGCPTTNANSEFVGPIVLLVGAVVFCLFALMMSNDQYLTVPTPVAVGVYLVMAAASVLIAGLWTRHKLRARHEPPSTGSDDWEAQPSPLPDPNLVRARGGHKPLPVNRELPMDRPHPWRTWEG